MRALVALGMLLALAPSGNGQTLNADPDSAQIITSDINHFWQAYDRIGPDATRVDSLRALFEGYYLRASPGLDNFIRMRIGSVLELADQLNTHRAYYEAVRPNMLRVHEMEPEIREGLRRMKALYPAAAFPDIYFLVGRMTSAGTLSSQGLYLGVEMLTRDDSTPTHELSEWQQAVTTSASTLPCIVVHELVHYQQDNAQDRSLLAHSINEGVADFLAEQAVGCHNNGPIYTWAEAREAELWAEFQEAMHGSEVERWLYNGGSITDRPSDLGYWMGYQIAEAYYDRAADKTQAIYDLLHIQDYSAFLEASGYGTRAD